MIRAVTIREVLRGVATARLDGERLLAEVLNSPRASLHAHPGRRLTRAQHDAFRRLHDRRLAGEPLAYITGTREFWSLPLSVTRDVLIPRPETEGVVARVLALAPSRPCRIADLGTGSGAIALALAKERPDTRITAVDLSAGALAVAHGNARRLGLGPIRFVRSDWYEALAGERFDIIACNPPYVAEGDLRRGQAELVFEPVRALRAGAQGMAAIHAVIQDAHRYLANGGYLVLEHGATQGRPVAEALGRAGFDRIRTRRDLAGLPRVSEGRLKAS